MGWLFSPKIQIIHFFHWHIPTIGPIKVTAWIGMLETSDGSTQLTGNDSIVETRQMEILMTAIFKEQQSNSWKIIIIIEMAISQNFRIIHNPSVINQFMWNQSCLLYDGLQTQKLGSKHPADKCFAPRVFWTFSKLFFSLKDFLLAGLARRVNVDSLLIS